MAIQELGGTMRGKRQTGLVAVEAAEAEIARIREAMNGRGGESEQLAEEREAAARELQRVLAAERLGDADDQDVADARERIARNAAAIEDYRALSVGLDAAMEQAKLARDGVIRDQSAEIEQELAERGRDILDRARSLEQRQ